MIDLLRDLQKELHFHILDLWDDPAMRAVSEEDYKRYMSDPVHPNIEGYRSWWTPKFIEFCQNL
jgi:lysophospholipase L1-like esterase